MNENLVVVSGTSAAGKTELVKAVEKRIIIKKVISCTTRRPRPGEVDGEHYRFFTYPYFMECVDWNEFAEHAEVHGNLYGTLHEDLDRQVRSGEPTMLVMDIQGLETIAKLYPGAQTFFVIAPMQDLLRRLNLRDANEAEREKRKQALATEIMNGCKSRFVRNIIHNKDGCFDSSVQEICTSIERKIGRSLVRS